MSGVAFVFGLCALSFAAGCVLTAVMLRREPPPDPKPEPAPTPPPPRFEPRFPPEDYATKPIHRNPVMGIPTALPAPRPARPNLVLVPDPEPATELPVRQGAVRRMHVVRPGAAPVEGWAGNVESPAEGREPADPVGGADAATAGMDPAGSPERAEPGAAHAETTEPGVTAQAEVAGPGEAAKPAEPAVAEQRDPARSDSAPHAFEAARRKSNR